MAKPAMVDATITDARLASPGPVSPPFAIGAPGLSVGHVLAGRYRIQRFIAAGGMGEVYEAEDALLGDNVAVKLLRPEMLRKPGAQERFAEEIRLARRITHPNVCRVFDVGIDGDHVFFTMELYRGVTLGGPVAGATLAGVFCRHAPLDRAAAAPILRQLLAGIGAAHDAGVIHTDLKPSNVLLTGRNCDGVVVTDFGLAISCCATMECPCSMPHLVGTPAYMAPEQVTGDPIVEASDIFSFGVILFEMMTGSLPWTGDTPLALAHARLEGDPPSARALRPDLDPSWDDVIRACLARSPADRPASAAAIARSLGL